MEQQRALTDRVARVFGYDMDRGRIDVAVHPFSSGSGNDMRITTRYDETNPLDSLYSTIHEVEHATYEQNVDPAYNFTPLGNGCSMAVHGKAVFMKTNWHVRALYRLAIWPDEGCLWRSGCIGCGWVLPRGEQR